MSDLIGDLMSDPIDLVSDLIRDLEIYLSGNSYLGCDIRSWYKRICGYCLTHTFNTSSMVETISLRTCSTSILACKSCQFQSARCSYNAIIQPITISTATKFTQRISQLTMPLFSPSLCQLLLSSLRESVNLLCSQQLHQYDQHQNDLRRPPLLESSSPCCQFCLPVPSPACSLLCYQSLAPGVEGSALCFLLCPTSQVLRDHLIYKWQLSWGPCNEDSRFQCKYKIKIRKKATSNGASTHQLLATQL